MARTELEADSGPEFSLHVDVSPHPHSKLFSPFHPWPGKYGLGCCWKPSQFVPSETLDRLCQLLLTAELF